MSDIKILLQYYPQIIAAIKQSGFATPILFKGFSSKEKHNFNLLVTDTYAEESELKPQISRLLLLKDKFRSYALTPSYQS